MAPERGCFCNHSRAFSYVRKFQRDFLIYKKASIPVIRTKAALYLRYTTYYRIPAYASPLTPGIRPDLVPMPSAGNSGVIFASPLLSPGFHHPRLSLDFAGIYCLHQSLSSYYIIHYHM